MLDLEAIGKRLMELDQTGRAVLEEDRNTDHRLFWTGVEATGRNLERLYRLAMGAELEARLAALEQREQEGGVDDAQRAYS